MVVAGSPRDYRDAHPTYALLVVEVSDLTSTQDHEQKRSLYARARLAEYWIVNIGESNLEVYRRPTPSPTAPYGWGYAEVQRLGRGATVAPVAVPTATIAVADLLR